MLNDLKTEWQELANAPAGKRFAQFGERQQARTTPVIRSVLLVAGGAALFAGGTLGSSSMPALLFLPLSGLLFLASSRKVGRKFDAVESFVSRKRRQPEERDSVEIDVSE